MNRRDRGVVLGLVAVLAILGAASLLPERGPAPIPTIPVANTESSGAPLPVVRAYREGIPSRPSSINPLTARTQADRDLVSLIFSGLVRLGPDGQLLPDLAEEWSVDATGGQYTFALRPDAQWHDGRAVTSADVVFTVQTLQDPEYTGPGSTSWREVTVTALDSRRVRFDLATPLGGFLQAATQPLLPEHLLRAVPIQDLARDEFSVAHPIGSGPFRLVSVDAGAAVLEPAIPLTPDPVLGSTVSPTPSVAPAARRLLPALGRFELHFFEDGAAVADAYRAGDLDAAVGLPPGLATQLATETGASLLRYPRATFTAIALNFRPGYPAYRSLKLRTALLESIDRQRLLADVLSGTGTRADSPIPPSSWAFDPAAGKPVTYNRTLAAKDLKAAGWKKLAGGWATPGAKKPSVIELITPDEASNPILWATAQAIVKGWGTLGIGSKVVGLPAANYVSRLQSGKFSAALLDINIGLDPDIYPLFASSQATSTGTNIAGLQVVALDRKLEAARRPGTYQARKAAYAELQKVLVENQWMLPIFYRDEVVVVSKDVEGPVVRELGDPSDRYWDVLTWRLAKSQ